MRTAGRTWTEGETTMTTSNPSSPWRSSSLARLFYGTLACILAACGGGGGGGSAVAPNPVVPAEPVLVCNLAIEGETSIMAGKTTGLIAQSSCRDPLQSITWSQVSGAPVTLIASRSPVLALESSTVGSITLKADAILSDGKSVSASTNINISAAPAASHITIRPDHAVKAGMDTSVRAWPTLHGHHMASNQWPERYHEYGKRAAADVQSASSGQQHRSCLPGQHDNGQRRERQ
jgi:hypothetical protein